MLQQIVNTFFDDKDFDKAELFRYPAFCEILPYRVYDDQVFINTNSVGAMLEFLPLNGHMGDSNVESLTKLLSHGLEEGTTVQIYRWESPHSLPWIYNWQQQKSQDNSIVHKILKERVRYLENCHKDSLYTEQCFKIRHTRCFLAISIPSAADSKTQLMDIAYIHKLIKQFSEILTNISQWAGVLDAEQALNVLEAWVHPNINGLHTHMPYDPYTGLHHQLSNGTHFREVKSDKIVFDDVEMVPLTICHVPSEWEAYLTGVLNGDENNNYSRVESPTLTVTTFTVLDLNKTKTSSNLRRMQLQKSVDSGIGKYIPSVKDEYQDWDHVVKHLSDGDRLVKCFQCVLVYDTPDTIDNGVHSVMAIYGERGYTLRVEKYGIFDAYLYSLPFMPADGMFKDFLGSGRLKTRLTSCLAHLINIYGDVRGISNQPLLYLLSRRGQPGYWNNYESNSNYNVAIVGKSGAGKSVVLQEIVTNIVADGGEVIVIDDGESFKSSCILLGGEYIVLQGDISINPFSMIDESTARKDVEYLEEGLMLVDQMVCHMARPKKGVMEEEAIRINTAIRHVWKQHGNNGTVTHVAEYLSKYQDTSVKDREVTCKIAWELSNLLQPYCAGGAMGKYFNSRHTVDITTAYTAYEMSVFRENKTLQGLVLIMIMFMVTNKMYHSDRHVHKALVIDEAWNLLDSPMTAKFVEGIARRARKYDGCLITGTQDLNDFQIGSASIAWSQSHWKVLMAQSPESINNATSGENRIMRLSDFGVLQAKSIRTQKDKYSEVLIVPSDSEEGYICRLVLDPFSLALYSSTAKDVEAIKQMQQTQGMSLLAAVEHYAQTKVRI